MNYMCSMTLVTNILCPHFLHGRMHRLFVAGVSNDLFALNGYHCFPAERGSFPIPAETESQHPAEVPAGERGAWSFPAQLLCLIQR